MLHQNSIYVWLIRPDSFTAPTAFWRSLLSSEEARKADAFRAEKHSRDYVTAHLALRFVLSACLGVPPGRVGIVGGMNWSGGEGSKPSLSRTEKHESDNSSLRFNLSHTHGAMLIGVALGQEIGVDIEWHRPMDDLEGMARIVMSNEELTQWMALAPDDQVHGFFHLWTRKEAYLKAIGLGLFRSLQDVTVPVSPHRLSNSLDPDSGGHWRIKDRAGKGEWSVEDIPVWDEYSASICWEHNANTTDEIKFEVREIVLGERELDTIDWFGPTIKA